MPIQMQDIESELSYAYLHAVASKAGFACEVAGRLADKHGIDATVRVLERIRTESVLTDFTIDIQLKATVKDLTESGGRFAFQIPVNQYDRLRSESAANQKLLVLFRLPNDPNRWLSLTEDELALRRCAYWVSLRGAEPVANEEQRSKTVLVPRRNRFSPEALREIAEKRSLEEYEFYED